MPRSLLPICLLSLLLAEAMAAVGPAELLPAEAPVEAGRFMLLELFTSEGCSSCPPADEFVNALHSAARETAQPLIVLSWHVDYWNRLKTKHGVWVDPYSSAEATARQTRYAQAVPAPAPMTGRLVTPQLLVDGRHLQRPKEQPWPAFIAARYAQERPARVQLRRTADGVEWAVSGAAAGSELLLALVQRDVTQHVDQGENHGRDLVHQNVVRGHRIVTLQRAAQQGSQALSLPEGVDAAHAGVVAVVQGSADLAVQAATAIDWADADLGLLDGRVDPLEPGCAGGVCALPLEDGASTAP